MPTTAPIKPSHKAIANYYDTLKSYADLQQTHETGIRSAFQRLLEDTARHHDWVLVAEVSQKAKERTIRPDATLYKNAVPRGYWEAKDTGDDLDSEVRKKIAKGYPTTNIIFEDTRRAILYQGKQKALEADLTDPAQVAHLLNTFFTYTEPVLEDYDQALDQFKGDVPKLAQGLVKIIEAAHKNNRSFQAAFAAFFELCKTALNPNISQAAVDEMLVQHLLTERLIRKIFDNPEFTQRNVIATEIEKVITALVSQSFSREEYLNALDTYYQAIEHAAHGLTFSEKQRLLNEVYERFFQGYSVKIADTHGIVYTPQPIVDFMCASVIEVLQTEFGKTLGDPEVVLLDPCTGTGNFIVNLINRAETQHLESLYRDRLFANEVMLLPYYIAALNIEHAYYERTRQYQPFEGLCFVDTLDIAEGAQMKLGFMNEENTERVERQKKAPITVIIGNPPYNVGQLNENDNNKNRRYDEIDKQIRATYAKDSRATNKNALSDVYVKFFRWAVSRLQGRDGIVCYVSNNSFVDQIAFDGMRKHLLQDFTRVYHVDLHGNVRQNPKLSGTTHNVFGIQVGVGITVAVRSSGHDEHKVYYHRVPEFWRKEEKLIWLGQVGNVQGFAKKALTPNPSPGGRGEQNKTAGGRGGQDEAAGGLNQPEERYRELAAKAMVQIGRDLRQRQTEAEVLLWECLRDRRLDSIKFRRQHPMPDTNYVVDFFCLESRLIIELDGPIHDQQQKDDAARQQTLQELGYHLLRFRNEKVFNDLQTVLTVILNAHHAHRPTLASGSPRPPGEGLGVRAFTMLELTPDSRHNWLVSEHADEFSAFLPMGSKETKSARVTDAQSIFKLYSGGVKTNRDDVVYDFDRAKLTGRVQQFIEDYNSEVDRYKRAGNKADVDSFVRYKTIKWSRDLKLDLQRQNYAVFDDAKLRETLYRPFCKQHLFFDRILNEEIYVLPHIFPTPESERENRVIIVGGYGRKEFALFFTNLIPDLNFYADPEQCFPFYTYDPDDSASGSPRPPGEGLGVRASPRRENITDWALTQFRDHYADPSISKWDIFYYVYGLLHHPGYREKFADNLKRELPRIPFAAAIALTPNPSPGGRGEQSSGFWAFAEAGRQLADLHLNYEQVEPFKLRWITAKDMPLSYRVEKMRLNKDKTALTVNESLTLADIPPDVFKYRLGNRSALEWVIDQYQVSTDKRSGITSDPNREDDAQYIVNLVGRVVAVSLATVKLVESLPDQYSP